MKELLLATQNSGKLKELQTILQGTQFHVVTPTDVGISPDFDVEESGTTYAENSELKAVAFAQKSGLLTLADDSGISVEALHGAPGVKSKRFFPGSGEARKNRILELLKDEKNRKAAYFTDLCLCDPETGKVVHFEGRLDGQIASESRGTNGFDYDPIFIPDGYDKTFGELSPDVKNSISHRKRGLIKAKEYLANLTF